MLSGTATPTTVTEHLIINLGSNRKRDIRNHKIYVTDVERDVYIYYTFYCRRSRIFLLATAKYYII
jgi:hypothetical protein